jgi:hypothetical protein
VTTASVPGPAISRRALHLVVYGALFALAVLTVPVLSVIGVRTLLDSRDGEVLNPVLDPAMPGYQALVSPSPTLAVLHLDPDGALVGVAVLALAGEDTDGGSVLLIPPRTLASVPQFGDFTLEYIQDLNGTDNTRSLVEFVLGLGLDDVVEVTDSDWAELVEPLGGIVVVNPDGLTSPDGSLVFPAGELTLEPDQVGPFLSILEPTENPLNRVLRQELVWGALLDALQADPSAVRLAGEQDRGLARFLPAIATGTSRLETLPIEPPATVTAPGETSAFVPDAASIAGLIPQLVPFPAGARPGDRPLVRVLDGSGRQSVIPSAVRHVAVAGGQVVMIGNTDEFGVTDTQVLVADDAFDGFAGSVADALGVGSVQRVDYIDENAEVIVVLGADYRP